MFLSPTSVILRAVGDVYTGLRDQTRLLSLESGRELDELSLNVNNVRMAAPPHPGSFWGGV